MRSFALVSVLSAAFLLFAAAAIQINAYPGGVSGNTLKGPSPGCTCHTSSVSSSVSLVISGPQTLQPGETGNYQVLMTYTSTISKGGMDIAASAGTLAKVDNRLKVLNGELTQPSSQNAGSTTLTWLFKYTAPMTPGVQTLYATGCAVKSRWNHAPNFTVTIGSANPALALTAPAGGEIWYTGRTGLIKWTSALVNNVKLEYSPDDGVNWTTIIASTPASAGQYSWIIPQISSQNCRVRVSDVSNSQLSSVSPVFTITELAYSYLIEHLHHNNTMGVSQDSGKLVILKGVVTSSAELGDLAFIQDSTGGMALSTADFPQFGSEIKTGDVIEIKGRVQNDFGMTRIDPLVSYMKTDSLKTVTPEAVTIRAILSQQWNGFEEYEDKLVQITGVTVLSSDSLWSADSMYTLTNGTDSIEVYIHESSSLAGTEIPRGHFDLAGLTAQRCGHSPYSSGYLILPRTPDDISNITGIPEEEKSGIPSAFSVLPAWPNPFNPSCTVAYTIQGDALVNVSLFSSSGELVQVLKESYEQQGYHTLRVDAGSLTSGIYFCRVTVKNSEKQIKTAQTIKLILLK
ncbi:MAG: DUF5689 domain-containing protein [Ignavibacteriaceae bacterium]|nr:DUF5689 domain-containing protein [Ignavibacteriaceae bacterium]